MILSVISPGRIGVIALKELRQLRRDRLTIGMMVLLPIMQLLLFGYAIDTDVRHMPTVVYDADRSPRSRDLVRRLEATGFYDVVGEARGYDDIGRAFRTGDARVALVVPAGFGRDLGRRRPTQVQLVVDGSDAQVVASATQTAAAVIAARSSELRVAVWRQGGPEPIEMSTSTWYNPDLRTAVYIVPGLVGVILTLTLVMFTAMGIARERERGTLEQLIVSPVRSIELIVGKIVPYIGFGYVQMTIVLGLGMLVFAVPLAGSLALLYGLASVFIAASLAVGLFFSTLARTQQQAMQMSVFFLLPNLLLSGFMFPFEGMPRFARVLGEGIPLTHFLRIIRSIVLKGATWTDVRAEVGWLAVLCGVLIAISALRFRKKLD
jgi:ABC-2 type transport system permease protein